MSSEISTLNNELFSLQTQLNILSSSISTLTDPINAVFESIFTTLNSSSRRCFVLSAIWSRLFEQTLAIIFKGCYNGLVEMYLLAYEEDLVKRRDYISWDEYFMGLALLSARRSKDPSTQVGASIVNEDNLIMSVGYNGMPRGCSDDEFPWSREGDDNKYRYVCHAELNAILNSGGRDLRDCRIYTALFPCNNCAKAIIQSGIREVCYLSDKYADNPDFIAARRMFDAAGVKLNRLDLEHERITLDLSPESV